MSQHSRGSGYPAIFSKPAALDVQRGRYPLPGCCGKGDILPSGLHPPGYAGIDELLEEIDR